VCLLTAVALALAAAQQVPDDSVFRSAGPVLHWNVVARELVERELAHRGAAGPPGKPPRATFYDGNNNSRLYALVSGAQYDALRRVADPGEGALAAASAAAAVLRTVFPRENGLLASEVAAERSRIGVTKLSAATARAAETAGRRAARRWVADAAAELRAPPWQGRVPSGPGRWRSDGEAPVLAISLGLRPWFLSAPDEFRPPPPPAPGSEALASALAAVRDATRHRSRAETRATWAWARNAATLWSEIAGEAILRQHLSQLDAARALMYLNMTLSDATIACWDAKFAYWYPRPSQIDSTLELSVPLPNFPSYPSAHATLFAAGAAVLGHLLPAEQPALDSLAREATMSRLRAGVHYPFDNAAGARLGRQVAGAALLVVEAEGR
jgi:membrane-associated phospholipid phosphatase